MREVDDDDLNELFGELENSTLTPINELLAVIGITIIIPAANGEVSLNETVDMLDDLTNKILLIAQDMYNTVMERILNADYDDQAIQEATEATLALADIWGAVNVMTHIAAERIVDVGIWVNILLTSLDWKKIRDAAKKLESLMNVTSQLTLFGGDV